MLCNVMAVHVRQNCPLFHALVDCFLTAAHTLLHLFILKLVCDTSWALRLFRSIANVSIIGLNTFTHVQPLRKTGTENLNIWICTCWKGAVDPYYITSENVKCNLISNSRFSIQLVGCKFATVICNRTISAINAKKIIVFAVTAFPTFKVNLAQRKEWVNVISFERVTGQGNNNSPLVILDQK